MKKIEPVHLRLNTDMKLFENSLLVPWHGVFLEASET
jgi:hypothetical protein